MQKLKDLTGLLKDPKTPLNEKEETLSTLLETQKENYRELSKLNQTADIKAQKSTLLQDLAKNSQALKDTKSLQKTCSIIFENNSSETITQEDINHGSVRISV